MAQGRVNFIKLFYYYAEAVYLYCEQPITLKFAST